MLRKTTIQALLLVAAVGLTGCGKRAPDTTKAFQSASPEIQDAWQSANAAMKTNGYTMAILQLRQLRMHPALTSEQLEALDHVSASISEKMYEAADKGDAGAKQAVEELRAAISR